MTVIARVGNAPDQQTIDIYRGATFTLPFDVKTNAGVAIDITGWTIAAQLRRLKLGASPVDFTVTVENAAQGLFYIELSAAQTAAIKCGELPGEVASKYWWDLRVQRADGRVAYTRQGEALIWAQATKPA